MRHLITLVILLFTLSISAQRKQYFTPPVEMFSKKKTSYITLNDGTEVVGKIKKLKRKKMLFEKIIIEDERGKKQELLAEDIKSMYLPQSGLDKYNSAVSKVYDMTQWGLSDLNQEHLKEGYAYFESTSVFYKKKKEKVLLLQLLNPAFPSQVKVFHDPMAREGGVSIGSTLAPSMKVAGGGDKSYFIKIGEDTAFKLKKKAYKDKAKTIFSACPDFLMNLKEELAWKYFGEDLLNYSKSCKL